MTRGALRALDGYLKKGGSAEKNFDRYLCEEHGIYITPTTLIYKDMWDNLLWHDTSDRELVAEIIGVKRVKAQLHHDSSEDAVTWNVFRFLEKSRLLSGLLEQLRDAPVTNPEAMYWAYCPSEGGVWSELANAWDVFQELPQRASEPDLIVKSDEGVFFIEAKLTSASSQNFNASHTAEQKAERVRRYSKGEEYLRDPVEDIVEGGYYQLMRFWVLGCWIAERLARDFVLVNLVRSGKDEGIEEAFGGCIRGNRHRRFLRLTWEEIYEFIANAAPAGRDRDRIMWYFKNKTIQYEKAFGVP